MSAVRISLKSLRAAAARRPDGYVEEVLAKAHEVTDTHAVLSRSDYAAFVDQYQTGPGSELSKLLKRFGIEPTPTCKCRAKARQMDAWGPDECSKPERIEEVLSVMRTEAKARGLPFIDAAGRMLLRLAIRNARKAAS